MGVCNNCHEVVLVKAWQDSYGSIRLVETYPSQLPSPTDDRIPAPMRRDLMEAKICFSAKAFRGCAVLARRSVQSACIQKGADRDKTLENQLDELYGKRIITETLWKWAHSVRWIGNDAAHPEAEEVRKEDAEDALKLAEDFLHYAYVTPTIADKQKEKRKKELPRK
jgi:hypothetical protein